VHFYEVGGLLVRRWMPARHRKNLEAWTGDGWALYPDVDNVLRHGRRLTESQGLALLHETRDRTGTLPPLSEAEALVALRDRLRRA
jgi:hypothetical protein